MKIKLLKFWGAPDKDVYLAVWSSRKEKVVFRTDNKIITGLCRLLGMGPTI